MPNLHSEYQAPTGLSSPHIQSIFPTLFRRLQVGFQRQVLELNDGDFLDLDWIQNGNERLVILSHGLEGSTQSPYIQGAAKYFSEHQWDVLAWNFRGCGGEPNRLPRFYHSGSSDDLEAVVNQAVATRRYRSIALIGYSMGGNQTLLYLSRHPLPEEIKAGVAFSVPCDLTSCADKLAKPSNQLYMRRFIRSLADKISHKATVFPDLIDASNFADIKSFHDFDERYTAPLHGFKDRFDYWKSCSSGRYLSQLQRPTLLVNAVDDPFLTQGCFPVEEAERNPLLFLETPKNGGHVGFIRYRINRPLWSEQRALLFLSSHLT
jgi:predicted alpha/beta-fold hydrolase